MHQADIDEPVGPKIGVDRIYGYVERGNGQVKILRFFSCPVRETLGIVGAG